MYILNASNPDTAFNSHPEVKETSGDFSSVDLSFLPDEVTQENKEQPVISSRHETEENSESQSPQSRLPSPSEIIFLDEIILLTLEIHTEIFVEDMN